MKKYVLMMLGLVLITGFSLNVPAFSEDAHQHSHQHTNQHAEGKQDNQEIDDTVTRFIKDLESPSAEVRRNAVNVLGQQKATPAVPALIKALKKEKNSLIRHTIVYYLGKIDDKSAVPVLVDILIDKKEAKRTRNTAAQSLGLIGEETTIEMIRKKMKGSKQDPFVEEKIVEISKQIDIIKSVSEEVSLLREADRIHGEASKLRRDGDIKGAIDKWKYFLKFYDEKLVGIHKGKLPLKFSKDLYVLRLTPEIYLNIAKCYEDLSLYKKAISTYKKWKKTKHWIPYFEYRIQFLAKNRDYRGKPLRLFIEAERLLERADMFDRSIIMKYSDGTRSIHLVTEYYDKAGKIFEKIIQTYPKCKLADDAYLKLAKCQHYGYSSYLDVRYASGVVKSVYFYHQLIKKYPKSQLKDDAMLLSGILYQKTKETDEAIEKYRKVVDNYPKGMIGSPMPRIIPYTSAGKPAASIALYLIGEIYEDDNKLDKAISTYEDIARRYPEDPLSAQGLYNAGRLYKKLGDLDKVIEIYLKLAMEYPMDTKIMEGKWHDTFDIGLESVLYGIHREYSQKMKEDERLQRLSEILEENRSKKRGR